MTPRLVLALLVAAAGELSAVALTGFATWLICRAAGGAELGALALAIVAMRAFAIGRGVLKYAERLTGHDAVLRLVARLRGRLFDALVPLAPYGMTSFRRGDLLARMVSDVDAVQDAVLRAVLPAVTALITGVVTTVYVASVLPAAAVPVAAGVLLTGIALPLAAVTPVTRTQRRLTAARAELAARTTDLLAGRDDLEAAGALSHAEDRQRSSAAAIAVAERRSARLRGATALARTMAQAVTAAVVAVIAVRGLGDGPMVAVLPLVTLAAMEVVAGAGPAAEEYARARPALSRLQEILRTPTLSYEDDEVVPHQGGLRLVGVTYRYPGAPRPAVADLDLTVGPGRTIVLAGPSGSGKSTVLGLALGFLTPDAGTARLGDRDLARIPAGEARISLVSGLTQDAYVFTGPIRGNLCLARPEATDGELWDALDQAGAGDWVRGLPDGLDTLLGADATTVSGGERQRLALAMALVTDAGLLVVDEPLEALDAGAAARVLAGLSGRSVLLTSHRLTGLEHADEIVVLQAGRVLDRGTHTELVARPGYYRERYEAERRALDLVTTTA